MRRLAILMTAVFTFSTCLAQAEPRWQAQQQDQAQTQAQTITLPTGTKIPIALVSAVWSKSTHVGDTIRGVTGFPVTVGTQLAIPGGTYVEGTIKKITKPRAGTRGELVVNFTKLVFANGYTVIVDAVTPEAKLRAPRRDERTSPSDGDDLPPGMVMSLDQGPTPPPLPKPKTSFGLVIGLAAAGAAVTAVVGLVFLARARGADYVIFGEGFQFDMVLQSPVSLDAERVAAAVNQGN